MKKYIYLIILCVLSFFLVSCELNTDNNQNDDPIFVKTYLIIFDGNGGTLVNGSENQSVEDPSQIVAPTYEKEGYEFDGWSADLTSITTDKMVYAIWKEIVVVRTVTFDANGGEYSGNDKEEISNGKLLMEPDEPSMVGYTFEGWFNGEVKWNFKRDTVTKNLTLKAHYKINQYSLTFSYKDGETEDKVITQDYGTPLSIEEPTRVGYTFEGWSENFETMPAENKTIEANWKINQYSVTLKYNDGVTNDKVITQDYGTSLSIENPTREGYTFVKWSEDIQTMPAGNKTISASWKINVYLLTIKYNDGVNKDKVIRLDYNEKIIIDTPSRTGYTFDCWSETLPERMPDRNVTLEAVWKINQYTLTIQYKDGITKDLVLTQDYDTEVSIETPSRIGYNFEKWSESINKMPAEDKTIEAVWFCDVKYYIENEKAIVTGFNKNNNIVVLDHYDGYETTEIGKDAFRNCATLVSIVLPSTVKTISDSAFYQCSALNSINLENVTSIGKDAFHDCIALVNISLSACLTIDESAFYECSALSSINSENVTSIGKDAFRDCSKLSGISLPSCLTIDNYAFATCTSLTKIENIENLIDIGEGVFSGCTKLASIGASTSLITIGPLAFSNCSSLESISLSNKLVSIGAQAFTACTAVSTLNIEVGNLAIDTLAFSGCTKLANLNFTEGVLSLGKQTFKDCTSLMNISFPEGLREVGISCFEGCSALASVSLPTTLLNIGTSAFEGCAALYTIKMQEGIQGIEANAFANCTALTSFTFPNSISQIGNGALKGCTKLNEITIPFVGSSSTETENAYLSYIFGGTQYSHNETNIPITLTKVTVTGNSNISNHAFRYCINLTEINFTGEPTTIGIYAFYDCENLSKIQLADTITEIQEKAFYNCTSLVNIDLPDSLTSIGEYAFYNCTSLAFLALPKEVTTLGIYAFSKCTSLVDFYCGDKLQVIDNHAFEQCTSLKSFNFNNNLISIGEYAFAQCALESVEIPDNVKTIKKYAFYDNEKLRVLTVSDSVETIEFGAFNYCISLQTVSLPFVGTSKDATSNNHFGYIFGATSNNYNHNNVPASLKIINIRGGSFIPYCCFYGVRCAATVTLYKDIKEIRESAFSLAHLTSITILGAVTKIEKCAIYQCEYLTSITLPEGLQRIEDEAFRYCYELNNIICPSTLTYIGPVAFCECYSLTDITFNTGLKEIGNCAFYKCTQLKNVTLPSSLVTIDIGAFSYCTSFSIIQIPSSVVNVKNDVFSDCTNLATIYLSTNTVPTTWDSNWKRGCKAKVVYAS